MFSVVVGHVLRTFTPIETELPLGGAATKPMEAHPNHFDTTLDDGVTDEARCCGVVSLNGRTGLRPSHLVEGIAKGDHFPGCGVQGCELCLGGGGQDKFDDVGDAEDWPIISRNGVILR